METCRCEDKKLRDNKLNSKASANKQFSSVADLVGTKGFNDALKSTVSIANIAAGIPTKFTINTKAGDLMKKEMDSLNTSAITKTLGKIQ